MARQIHESVGRTMELDRVLGMERNGAGASFLTTDRLGSFDFGSSEVNLYADAREPGAPGTFGFDDEGVEAQRVELVTEGRFTGYLSSRETAERVGLERSTGAMRAAGWSSFPMVRMTNVSLEPGEAGDLDELIADTKAGVLMDGPRAFSSDELGGQFEAACETAWEIKNGKKTRRLKNPTYHGLTPAFWRACDAIGGESSWAMHGIAPDLKGRPLQPFVAGHGSAPARFVDVEVGVHDSTPKLFADGDAIPRIDHPEASGLLRRSHSIRTDTGLLDSEEDEDEEEEDEEEDTVRPTSKKSGKPKKKKRALRGAKKRGRK
jgi:TldD protein